MNKLKLWIEKNPKIVRWAKSTLHTFLSGFLAGVLLGLGSEDPKFMATTGLLSALLNLGFRSGIKAVAENGIEELKNK